MVPRGDMPEAKTGNLSSAVSSTSRTEPLVTQARMPLAMQASDDVPPHTAARSVPPESTTMTDPAAAASMARSTPSVSPVQIRSVTAMPANRVPGTI